MTLRDLYTVPPVHPVKAVPQSASGVGQPWAPSKVALTFGSVLGESDLIYLREMIMLYNHELVPVNQRLCSVWSPAVLFIQFIMYCLKYL